MQMQTLSRYREYRGLSRVFEVGLVVCPNGSAMNPYSLGFKTLSPQPKALNPVYGPEDLVSRL